SLRLSVTTLMGTMPLAFFSSAAASRAGRKMRRLALKRERMGGTPRKRRRHTDPKLGEHKLVVAPRAVTESFHHRGVELYFVDNRHLALIQGRHTSHEVAAGADRGVAGNAEHELGFAFARRDHHLWRGHVLDLLRQHELDPVFARVVKLACHAN